MIIKPVVTEKSVSAYQNKKICTFYVLPSANKFQIKRAFEEMFKVKVKKIRTSKKKPVLHNTRYLRKSPTKVYTKLQKKAFVELMPGYESKLKDFFGGEG